MYVKKNQITFNSILVKIFSFLLFRGIIVYKLVVDVPGVLSIPSEYQSNDF